MKTYKIKDIVCDVIDAGSFKINENTYNIKRTDIESSPDFGILDPFVDVFFLFKNNNLVKEAYSYYECLNLILLEFKL